MGFYERKGVEQTNELISQFRGQVDIVTPFGVALHLVFVVCQTQCCVCGKLTLLFTWFSKGNFVYKKRKTKQRLCVLLKPMYGSKLWLLLENGSYESIFCENLFGWEKKSVCRTF